MAATLAPVRRQYSLPLNSAARTYTVDSVCVGIVTGSSARRSPPQLAEIRKLRVNLQLLKSKWCLIWYVIAAKQLLRHYRKKYSLLIQKINLNASNFEAPPAGCGRTTDFPPFHSGWHRSARRYQPLWALCCNTVSHVSPVRSIKLCVLSDYCRLLTLFDHCWLPCVTYW